MKKFDVTSDALKFVIRYLSLVRISMYQTLKSVQVIFVIDTEVSYYCIYYEYYLNRCYIFDQCSAHCSGAFCQFLSGGFTTMAVINPSERKLAITHLCSVVKDVLHFKCVTCNPSLLLISKKWSLIRK